MSSGHIEKIIAGAVTKKGLGETDVLRVFDSLSVCLPFSSVKNRNCIGNIS